MSTTVSHFEIQNSQTGEWVRLSKEYTHTLRDQAAFKVRVFQLSPNRFQIFDFNTYTCVESDNFTTSTTSPSRNWIRNFRWCDAHSLLYTPSSPTEQNEKKNIFFLRRFGLDALFDVFAAFGNAKLNLDQEGVSPPNEEFCRSCHDSFAWNKWRHVCKFCKIQICRACLGRKSTTSEMRIQLKEKRNLGIITEAEYTSLSGEEDACADCIHLFASSVDIRNTKAKFQEDAEFVKKFLVHSGSSDVDRKYLDAEMLTNGFKFFNPFLRTLLPGLRIYAEIYYHLHNEEALFMLSAMNNDIATQVIDFRNYMAENQKQHQQANNNNNNLFVDNNEGKLTDPYAQFIIAAATEIALIFRGTTYTTPLTFFIGFESAIQFLMKNADLLAGRTFSSRSSAPQILLRVYGLFGPSSCYNSSSSSDRSIIYNEILNTIYQNSSTSSNTSTKNNNHRQISDQEMIATAQEFESVMKRFDDAGPNNIVDVSFPHTAVNFLLNHKIQISATSRAVLHDLTFPSLRMLAVYRERSANSTPNPKDFKRLFSVISPASTEIISVFAEDANKTQQENEETLFRMIISFAVASEHELKIFRLKNQQQQTSPQTPIMSPSPTTVVSIRNLYDALAWLLNNRRLMTDSDSGFNSVMKQIFKRVAIGESFQEAARAASRFSWVASADGNFSSGSRNKESPWPMLNILEACYSDSRLRTESFGPNAIEADVVADLNLAVTKLATKLRELADSICSFDFGDPRIRAAPPGTHWQRDLVTSFDDASHAATCVSAIFIYSLDAVPLYRMTNERLRRDPTFKNAPAQLVTLRDTLKDFLVSMPGRPRVLYRGQSYRVVENLDESAPPFLLETFTSTTTEFNVAYQAFLKGNRCGSFLIYICYNAVDISPFSMFKDECEVLLPFGAKYETVARVPLSHLAIMNQRFDVACLSEPVEYLPDEDNNHKNASTTATTTNNNNNNRNDHHDDSGKTFNSYAELQERNMRELLEKKAGTFKKKQRRTVVPSEVRVQLNFEAMSAVSKAYREIQNYFMSPCLIEESTAKKFPLLEAVRQLLLPESGAKGRTFMPIRAVAGMGKSTASIYINSYVNENKFEGYHSLLISLPSIGKDLFEKNALENYVQTRLRFTDDDMMLLRSKKLLLVLDSLDEVSISSWPRDRGIGEGMSANLWPNLRVIITCRGEHLQLHGLDMGVLSNQRGHTFGIDVFSRNDVKDLMSLWIPSPPALPFEDLPNANKVAAHRKAEKAAAKSRDDAFVEYTQHPLSFQTPFMLYLLAHAHHAKLKSAMLKENEGADNHHQGASDVAGAIMKHGEIDVDPPAVSNNNDDDDGGMGLEQVSSSLFMAPTQLQSRGDQNNNNNHHSSSTSGSTTSTTTTRDANLLITVTTGQVSYEREVFQRERQKHREWAREHNNKNNNNLLGRETFEDFLKNDDQASSSSPGKEGGTSTTTTTRTAPQLLDPEKYLGVTFANAKGITGIYELGVKSLIVQNILHMFHEPSIPAIRRLVNDVFEWSQLLAVAMLAAGNMWKGTIDDFPDTFMDEFQSWFTQDPTTMVLLAPLRISGYSALSLFEFRHKSVQEFLVAYASANCTSTRILSYLRKINFGEHPNIQLFHSMLAKSTDLVITAADPSGAVKASQLQKFLGCVSQMKAARVCIQDVTNDFANPETDRLECSHIDLSCITHLELNAESHFSVPILAACKNLQVLILSDPTTPDEAIRSTIVNNAATLHSVDLSSTDVSDETIGILFATAKRFEALNLSRTYWKRETLFNLAASPVLKNKIKYLRYLDLSHDEEGQLDDGLLESILATAKNVQNLNVSNCSGLTAKGFTHIGNLAPDLIVLNVSRTDIDDLGLQCILKLLSYLCRFSAAGAKKLTDRAGTITTLACRHLMHLDVSLTHVGDNALANVIRLIQDLHVFHASRNVTDVSLLLLAECAPLLRELSISHSFGKVTDEAISKVAKHCALLRSISLHDSRGVTDKSINDIAQLCQELREVKISDTRNITDAGLTSLASRCRNLRTLDFGGTFGFITDQTILAIAQHCDKLEKLVVTGTGGAITDKSISVVAQSCKYLECLEVGLCKGLISDESLIKVAKHCPRLRRLSVVGSFGKVTDASLKLIAQASPQLRSLDVAYSGGKVTSDTIMLVARCCPNLEELNISNTNHSIKDDALMEVAKRCRRLKDLNIAYTMGDVTDVGVIEISRKCRTLKKISIAGSEGKITQAAIDELKKNCRHVTIVQ